MDRSFLFFHTVDYVFPLATIKLDSPLAQSTEEWDAAETEIALDWMRLWETSVCVCVFDVWIT